LSNRATPLATTPRAQASRVIEIKNQISGGCLSGTTKECSEFRRTASQTRFLVTFCRAQKVTRLPGRDPAPPLKHITATSNNKSHPSTTARVAFSIQPLKSTFQPSALLG
ncbi:hypothetical protein, partial [Comamonas kerstersii]|uniref:hypothetical protein n=1 Tax=Comamonas kerstersii TaxID=225992 RepID=UPI003A95DB54